MSDERRGLQQAPAARDRATREDGNLEPRADVYSGDALHRLGDRIRYVQPQPSYASTLYPGESGTFEGMKVYEPSQNHPLRRKHASLGSASDFFDSENLKGHDETLAHAEAKDSDTEEDEEDPTTAILYNVAPGKPVSISELPHPDNLIGIDVPKSSPALPPESGGPQLRSVWGALKRGIKHIPPYVWVRNKGPKPIVVVVSQYEPSRMLTKGGVNASATGGGVEFETQVYSPPATTKTIAPNHDACFPLWRRRDDYGVISIGKPGIEAIKNDWIPAGSTAVYVPGKDLELFDLKKNRLRIDKPLILNDIEDTSKEIAPSPVVSTIANAPALQSATAVDTLPTSPPGSNSTASVETSPSPPPRTEINQSFHSTPQNAVETNYSSIGAAHPQSTNREELFAIGDLTISFSVLCSISPERRLGILEEAIQTRLETLQGTMARPRRKTTEEPPSS